MSMTTREQQGSETVPTTMRAAVYRGVNDVRVETIPVPEIGAGEVLVTGCYDSYIVNAAVAGPAMYGNL